MQLVKKLIRETFFLLLFVLYLQFKCKKIFTYKQIEETIEDYADRIIQESKKHSIIRNKVTFIVVLEGGRKFANALAAKIINKSNLRINFLFARCASYGLNAKSSKNVKIQILNLDSYESDATTYVIEDTIENGRTIFALANLLINIKIKPIAILCLFDKSKGKIIPVDPELVKGLRYSGELFLFGWGLDLFKTLRWFNTVWGIEKKLYEKIKEKYVTHGFLKACF